MFGTESRIQAMLQDYPSAVMLITMVMAFLMTGPMFLVGGIRTQVFKGENKLLQVRLFVGLLKEI